MQGRYQQFSLDAGYWFQDRNKRAVDRAYLGYRFDERSDLQVGAPARPFGLLPYPQFGWSYHIPFFLGFGVNTGTGLKYGYKDSDSRTTPSRRCTAARTTRSATRSTCA